MMAFAVQNDIHDEMMEKMNMDCHEKTSETECCESTKLEISPNYIKSDTEVKILKIKLISFVDIFNKSSNFFKNKNLIKNTSPPNIENKIKHYSYSDLVKIIKSNI